MTGVPYFQTHHSAEAVMRRKVYRDAVTGEYCSREYALAHPDTTVSETVETYDPNDDATVVGATEPDATA